jgi:glyoxylase-like metal-dependent hydrolase (beta-lactamase superfamily II)
MSRRPPSKTAAPITIVNVGYRSTNYWVISAGRSRLLVDLGWPGRVEALLHEFARAGVPREEVTHGFATHYHLDHAGAAEDLKRLGMTLVVCDVQQSSIPLMARHVKPDDHYTPITDTANLVVTIDESRALLARLGISGQFVHTPGHSDDSVSVLLDSGEVFTGDLTMESFMTDDRAVDIRASWDRLRALGASTVYPAHGRPYPLPPAPAQ